MTAIPHSLKEKAARVVSGLRYLSLLYVLCAGIIVVVILLIAALLNLDALLDYRLEASREKYDRVISSQLFNSWDHDQDGKVLLDEFPYSENLYIRLTGGLKRELTLQELTFLLNDYKVAVNDLMRGTLGWFDLLDKNENGQLDEGELVHLLTPEYALAKFDLNHNGFITRVEAEQVELPPHRWRALREAEQASELFSELDRDRDERLSREELGRSSHLVQRMDISGDGQLGKEELDVVHELLTQGPIAFERYGLSLLFDRLDHDEDSVLTERELKEYAVVMQWMDRNGNEVVDKEEFLNLEEAKMKLLKPVRFRRDRQDGN